MKLACYHTVPYKGYDIHYLNGLYRIGGIPHPAYLSMNAAKAKVDMLDAEKQAKQLLSNQKQADAHQTADAKR
jgi:hypothetical protein